MNPVPIKKAPSAASMKRLQMLDQGYSVVGVILTRSSGGDMYLGSKSEDIRPRKAGNMLDSLDSCTKTFEYLVTFLVLTS